MTGNNVWYLSYDLLSLDINDGIHVIIKLMLAFNGILFIKMDNTKPHEVHEEYFYPDYIQDLNNWL